MPDGHHKGPKKEKGFIQARNSGEKKKQHVAASTPQCPAFTRANFNEFLWLNPFVASISQSLMIAKQ